MEEKGELTCFRHYSSWAHGFTKTLISLPACHDCKRVPSFLKRQYSCCHHILQTLAAGPACWLLGGIWLATVKTGWPKTFGGPFVWSSRASFQFLHLHQEKKCVQREERRILMTNFSYTAVQSIGGLIHDIQANSIHVCAKASPKRAYFQANAGRITLLILFLLNKINK